MRAKSPLAGKVVCITGAGRGLGRAMAKAFAAEGAQLVLGARTTPEIDALAEELAAEGCAVLAVQTDVRLRGDVERLVEAATAEFGRLDIMVNNAGVAIYGPADTYDADAVDVVLDTNVKGVIHGSIAALRVMKGQRSGLIVNIGSIAGKWHLPGESVYCASKWAVTGYTGTLRLEAAAFDVKVSCVLPGGIDTPFWKAQETLPFGDDLLPERDFMAPEEVAESVVELARKSARYVVPELVMVPLVPRPPR
jgi:NADP-dependent 3-hydroxy acid dehydrogenase YdfG